ncbi:MAG: DUF1385 domain-containing protein [Candidatus Cloacimonadota bacterium]|nr:DUF1385 domain-containing protein [Candidatus Cloacimonadota bacterium]
MDEKKIQVGGQAVIEGVMMRGPKYLATAIRRKDKSIEVKKEKFTSITQKVKFFGLPIIRGFVSLIEMLIIGIKTLNFSAQRAEIDWQEESNKKIKEKSKFRRQAEDVLGYALAFGLAFLLFVYLPYQLASWLNLSKDNLYFNLFAGVIRIIFFVVYIWLISYMKDVKRLFQYHGAEHKSVFAYENKVELTPSEIENFSTLHPRCGTSFIFFVLLVSIIVFSAVDTLVAYYWQTPSLPLRIAYHLVFLTPLISGISYEILKLSGKNINHPLVKLMTAPGLALQKITTQKPDHEQIETAVIAMKCALEMEIPPSIKFIKDE